LCTLWQQLGQAVWDPSNEASGIYIVEPQYMDSNRKKAKERATARTEKAQQKQPQGATELGNVAAQEKTRSHKGKAGPSTWKKNQSRLGLPDITPARATNKLIVIQPHHQQDYKVAAMDAYINAHSQGICRHKISDEFFGNGHSTSFLFHQVGIPVDKLPVDPSLACSNENCRCCVATNSHLCCDTCNPDSFIFPVPSTSASKQTHAPNKFKVDTRKYWPTDLDQSLTSALQDKQKTQLGVVGILGDYMYGLQLIMTDNILECIVELAHFNQLDDLVLIRAQVNWHYGDMWGLQILELVKEHFPKTDSVNQYAPAPHRAMLQPTSSDDIPRLSNLSSLPDVQASVIAPAPNTSNPKPHTQGCYKCSACGSSAHIGMPHHSHLLNYTDILGPFSL
jgi:hypothetical protein